MKKTIVSAVLALLVFVGAHAQKSSVFAPNGKAIKGYDPVAFFTESKPVMGKENFSYKWNGAEWYFSSQENMEKFKANPEKYAPQYGGYCAYGMSQGHKAPTETETWTVLDDKLYFNYNSKVKEMFNKDRQGYIEKADKNWPELKDKP
ncbi:MAG: YHS domain-containing protein [Bacteroidetes bacterium]|nr:YHS domain-containing protein [Bacteroidota bacterium]